MTSEADLYVFQNFCCVYIYDKCISYEVVFSRYYDMFHPLFVVVPYHISDLRIIGFGWDVIIPVQEIAKLLYNAIDKVRLQK